MNYIIIIENLCMCHKLVIFCRVIIRGFSEKASIHFSKFHLFMSLLFVSHSFFMSLFGIFALMRCSIHRLKGGKSLKMKRLSKVRRVRVAVQKVRVKARRKSLMGGNIRRKRPNMPHQPHLNNNHLGMGMPLLLNMYHSNLHRLM